MKKCLIVLCILFTCKGAFSQEFMHSLGGKYFFYANSDGFYSTTILYSPRVNVSSSENSSISVGTHLGLGFSFYSGPYGSSSSFVFDIPLVAEYNFGFGSSSENSSGFGGYVGAGYGIHRVSLSVDGSSGAATIHGPSFTGGVRFDIPGIGPFDIGASYMLDLKNKDTKVNIFGVSISYLLGMGSRN